MKKRSIGVTIFGILFIVLNILGLLTAVYVLVVIPRLVAASGNPQLQTEMNQTFVTMQSPRGLLNFAMLVPGLVAGVGVLKLQNWARLVTLVIAGISFVQTVIGGLIGARGLIDQQPFSVVFFVHLSMFIMVAWDGLVLWYFLRPGVKAQFKSAHSE